MVSAIYLLRKLPCGSSILPSIAPRGFGRTTLRQWYTRTCSLQTEQRDDHPSPGELLPHLLTLATSTKKACPCKYRGGGCFLLPAPAVADCWHFHQWSVLCCPDFPLVSFWTPAADRSTAFKMQRYIFFSRVVLQILNLTNIISFGSYSV